MINNDLIKILKITLNSNLFIKLLTKNKNTINEIIFLKLFRVVCENVLLSKAITK